MKVPPFRPNEPENPGLGRAYLQDLVALSTVALAALVLYAWGAFSPGYQSPVGPLARGLSGVAAALLIPLLLYGLGDSGNHG